MRLPPELPAPTLHERLVTCVSALKRSSSKRRSSNSDSGHFEAGRYGGDIDLHYLRILAEECASEYSRLREENAMLLAELLRLRPAAGPCAIAGGHGHGFAVERELRSSLVSVESYAIDADANLWSRRLSPAVPQPLPQPQMRPEPPPPPPQPPQPQPIFGSDLDEEALHLPGPDPSSGSPRTSINGSHQPFAGSGPAHSRRPSFMEPKESLPGTIVEEEDDHCLPLRLDGQVSQELRVAGWAEPSPVRSENDTQPLKSMSSLNSLRPAGSLSSRASLAWERVYLFLRVAIQSRLWDAIGVITLVFALFGGSLWVVLDVPDRPGTAVLDGLQSIVMILFMIEVLVNSIVLARKYVFTFFFWMDCLGTLSMVFEISFLLGGLGSDPTGTGNNNSLLLRSARAAKVGARVGRLSKILKCFVIFQKSRQRVSDRDSRPHEPQPQERLVEARVLSKILMLNLSTKVSLLTFLLVLVVPLFSIGQYPEVDLSMQVWTDRLELEFSNVLGRLTSGSLHLANATSVFQGVINEMLESYNEANVDYFPYNIEGYGTTVWIDGVQVSFAMDSLLTGDRPRRKKNVLRQEVTRCLVQRPMCNGDSLAFVDFNFKAPHQLESTMDMVMIVFIITVMVVATGNLSHTLDGMLVKPVENMLSMVVTMASQLLSQFHKIHGVMETEEEDDEDGQRAETEVLEAIFHKLARMARLAAERNVASEEEIQSMDAEGRGVIVEMLSLQPKASGAKNHSFTGRPEEGLASMAIWGVRTSGPALLPGNEAIVDVNSLPVSEDVIETFELDVLQFDNDRLEKIILYIFFDSQLGFAGRRANVRLETFLLFHQTVRSEYNDLPYHSYAHACDVLHTVFRLLCMTFGPRWLSKVQQYALLVAALCHDVGHEGRTNPFLVETGHELALRYNDLSPLENMHCARLFDICSREGSNVFGGMDTNGRKEARRVCVATILHTDNAKHFDMVKEINQIYEMASEICEAQAAFVAQGEEPPLSHPYEAMVLQKDSLTWLELFLHLADCSNPLKPFRMCQCWADRILAEFFVQGDAEKELGIPVGMLNDRDKVNRAGSQHGFINFLVAPLVTCTVRLFPTLYPLATQMASNLEAWRHIWVAQAHPSADELAKRDAEVQKVREVAQQLQARVDFRRSSRSSTRSP